MFPPRFFAGELVAETFDRAGGFGGEIEVGLAHGVLKTGRVITKLYVWIIQSFKVPRHGSLTAIVENCPVVAGP